MLMTDHDGLPPPPDMDLLDAIGCGAVSRLQHMAQAATADLVTAELAVAAWANKPRRLQDLSELRREREIRTRDTLAQSQREAVFALRRLIERLRASPAYRAQLSRLSAEERARLLSQALPQRGTKTCR